MSTMNIKQGRLDHPCVLKLLEDHLSDMRFHSPPESVHALDINDVHSVCMTLLFQKNENKTN